MARPRSRFVGRQGGHRRLTQWVGPPAQAFVAVANGGATIIDSLVIEESATIVRNRGAVVIRPSFVGADLAIVGAYGVGVVSSEAFTAGIASVPEPYSDADWGGWMVWRSFASQIEFDVDGTFVSSFQLEIDLNAMRKVTPNEVVVYVAESQSGAFSVMDGLRTLVKLS